MSAQDIRKNLELLESAHVGKTGEIGNERLDEKDPMPFLSFLRKKIAATFDPSKEGEIETGKLANQTYIDYLRYLGTIGKKPSTEDIGDLVAFLGMGGGADINTIKRSLSKGLKVDLTDTSKLKDYWDTVIKTDYKNKIGSTFLAYAQGMADKSDADLEPSDLDKNAKAAQNMIKAGAGTSARVGDDADLRTSDPYERYKGEIRRIAAQPSGKPLPGPVSAKFRTELLGDIQKMKKGDKETGAYIGQKILKYSNAGYDLSTDADRWLAAAKVGERFLTSSEYRDISRMLKEHGLTWKSIGLRVRIDESVGSDGVYISLIAA